MKEIWKDITGYEGLYQASNMGNIRRLGSFINRCGFDIFIKGRILKPAFGKRKYLALLLSKNNIKTTHYVHRMVCECFHENPENKQTINHIDSNKLNNRADNLEWSTYVENTKHSFQFGGRKNKSNPGISHPSNKPVIQYSKNGDFISEFYSIAHASSVTGINKGNIGQAANGRQYTSGNFIWKFKNT